MKPQKKRTKKHNPILTYARAVESTFSKAKVGVLYIGSRQFCDFVSLKTLNKEKNTVTLCDAIMNYPLFWTVINAVFLIEANGKMKSFYEQLSPNHPCLQHQMSDSLTAHHRRLIDELRSKGLSKHIVNLGWLAVPYHLDLDECYEQIDQLFSKHGAYDCRERFIKNINEDIITKAELLGDC